MTITHVENTCYTRRVLQRVAVYCSVLQCVAVCCSVLQCVAVCCFVLQCVAVCCSVLQCVVVWWQSHTSRTHVTLLCLVPCCFWRHAATHCNTLQHTHMRVDTSWKRRNICMCVCAHVLGVIMLYIWMKPKGRSIMISNMNTETDTVQTQT